MFNRVMPFTQQQVQERSQPNKDENAQPNGEEQNGEHAGNLQVIAGE